MNVFITGATGFIGGQLASTLGEENNISILVRKASVAKVRWLEELDVKVILGSLHENHAYQSEVRNADYVFHCAANIDHTLPKEPLYQTNTVGTRKLLEVCSNHLKRFVYMSTADVTGVIEEEQMKEDRSGPPEFRNWYEWSKREGEKIVIEFYHKYNIPVTIVRPHLVYGPGSIGGLNIIIKMLMEKENYEIFGDGQNTFQVVHVDDVVKATIRVAENLGSIGKIYNIAGEYVCTMNEFVNICTEVIGKKITIHHIPLHSVETTGRISPQTLRYLTASWSYSCEALKSTGYIFKYKTKDDLKRGIANTVEYLSKSSG